MIIVFCCHEKYFSALYKSKFHVKRAQRDVDLINSTFQISACYTRKNT